MEAKFFFDGETPFVSTYDFHKDRERAPHWDQPTHRGRLEMAVKLAYEAAMEIFIQHENVPVRIVDLGCGDGGLLQQLKQWPTLIMARGYDFQPSNRQGWDERGVDAEQLNFVERWDEVVQADVYVITECLEHLADPHGVVRRIHDRGAHIVASSPWTEHDGSHDECHAWAWDVGGYTTMMTNAGFSLARFEQVGMFQVYWGRP